MFFLNLKIEKNAFRMHEEQNSNGANNNFGDGETGVLRVLLYTIYWGLKVHLIWVMGPLYVELHTCQSVTLLPIWR